MAQQMMVDVGADVSGFRRAFGQLPGIAGGPLKAVAVGIAGIGAGITAIGIKGVRDFTKFSEGVAKFGTMLTDVERKQLPMFRKEISRAAVEFGRSTTDLNQGMFDVISSGYRGKKAMEVLRASTTLAVGGAADLAGSTSSVISLMKVYGDELDNASEASDFFFRTQLQARSSVEEMAAAFPRMLPTAKAAGVELEKLGAMFATVTLGGKSTAEAVTGLDAMLLSLSAPTKEVAQRFVDLGVVTREADGGLRDIRDIVKQMAHLDLEQLRRLIPEKEALGAFLILRDNIEQFPELLAGMGKEAKSAGEAMKEMQKEPAEKFKQLTEQVNKQFRAIGEKLMPSVIGLTDKFSSFMEVIDREELVTEFAHQMRMLLDTFTATGKAIGSVIRMFGWVDVGAGDASDALADLVQRSRELDIAYNELTETHRRLGGQAALNIQAEKAKLLEAAMISVKAVYKDSAAAIIFNAEKMGYGAATIETLDAAVRQHIETQENLAGHLERVRGAVETVKETIETTVPPVKELSDEMKRLIKQIEKLPAVGESVEEFGSTWMRSFQDMQTQARQTVENIANDFDLMVLRGEEIGPKMAEAMTESLLRARETLGALTPEGRSIFEDLMGVTPEAFEKMKETFAAKTPELMESLLETIEDLPEEQKNLIMRALGTTPEQLDEMVADTGTKMELMRGMITTFGAAVKKSASAFSALGIKGDSPFGKAMGKMAAVQDLISLAQAVWQIARAAAEAAGQNYPKAAMHVAAASAYMTSAAAGKKAKAEIKAADTAGGAALGGVISGPPGVDKVPIMTTAGEGVLTPTTVKGILSDLTGQAAAPAAGGGMTNTFYFTIEGDALDAEALVAKTIPAMEKAMAEQTFSLQAGLVR